MMGTTLLAIKWTPIAYYYIHILGISIESTHGLNESLNHYICLYWSSLVHWYLIAEYYYNVASNLKYIWNKFYCIKFDFIGIKCPTRWWQIEFKWKFMTLLLIQYVLESKVLLTSVKDFLTYWIIRKLFNRGHFSLD